MIGYAFTPKPLVKYLCICHRLNVERTTLLMRIKALKGEISRQYVRIIVIIEDESMR